MAAQYHALAQRRAAGLPPELNQAARDRLVAKKASTLDVHTLACNELAHFDAARAAHFAEIDLAMRKLEWDLREGAPSAIAEEIARLHELHTRTASVSNAHLSPQPYRESIEDLTLEQRGRAVPAIVGMIEELLELQLQGLDAAGAEAALSAFRHAACERLRAFGKA